jgi:3-keto-disaccharide hydrolase
MKYLLLAGTVVMIAATPVLQKKSPAMSAMHINTLTDAEKKEGWVSLFDGKTTAGWHTYGKDAVGSAWKVKDGALALDASEKSSYQSKGGGDIITNKQYENFDFKAEWKISPKGNSGILFDIKEDKKYEETWYTGPEMQVLDNDGHDDGKIKKHRAGDLYDLISSSSEPVKAVGEWNEAEIKLNKGKLDLYLNGVNVVSTTMWDDNWWALVKGSKFVEMPDFTKYKSGHIALQDHGCDVWYRNIKIKQL